MEVILDMACCTGQDAVHDYLKSALGLPEYYGRNLDALYDCLLELPRCRVVLHNSRALKALGEYGERLLETLNDAALDNPALELIYRNDA